MMDVKRQPKKHAWLRKKWYWPLGAALFAGAVVGMSQVEISAYEVTANQLLTGKVQQGQLSVTIRGNGLLVPKDIRWIAANVEGRIDRVLFKAGAVVKEGDLLVEMSNPKLQQVLEETQWELEAMTAEQQALKVSLETQLLDQQARVLNAEMNYESAKMRLEAEQILLDKGNASVSMLDYKKSQLEKKQYDSRWQIERQRFDKLKENQLAQLNAQQARLNKLSKTLLRAQEQVQSLMIRASLDGVVQDMPLESGQRVSIGGNIAKLARQDQLFAEIKIPERQIRDVAIGQPVVIDTRLNRVNGKVVRIDPAVNNGTVQVDVEFDGPLPSEARPDLSIDGTITVAEFNDTLHVGRPTFAQSNSTSVVYKLTDDGQHAHKTRVRFGRGSSNHIQILEGLSPGEQIILSDHSAWQHIDKISIQ